MSAGAARRHCPFPEIIEARPDRRPYTILDSTEMPDLPSIGMVNMVERVLCAPLNARGVATIRHELAHVRWSPSRLPRVPYDVRVLMAVEDARINLGMERLGLPVRLDPGDRGRVTHLAAEDLARGDHAAFLLRAVASLGVDAGEAVLAAAADQSPVLERLARGLLARVFDQLEASRSRRRDPDAPVATFAAARRAADALAQELGAHGLLVDGVSGPPLTMPGVGCVMARDLPDAGGAAALGRAARRRRRRPGASRAAKPGRLRVVEARLPLSRARTRSGGLGWRASAEGAVMRYPERWPIDQSIFRRPRTRASAGTVLIDMSGSMELNEHDVDAILNATGAATLIAIYSGRGDQGELKVVARRGVRADAKDLKRFGAHNVVDAPALAWLGAQPKPRVWVSDGRVTGIGDAVSAEVTGLCRELCGRFAIRRVESAEEAGEVLRGRSTPVRVAVR